MSIWKVICTKREDTHTDHHGKEIIDEYDIQCDQSRKVRFMIYKGGMNAQMFIKFLRQLIKGAKRKFI